MPNPDKFHVDTRYQFVGMVMGLSFSSGMALELYLPTMFWKLLAKDKVSLPDLFSVDAKQGELLKRLRDNIGWLQHAPYARCSTPPNRVC